MRGKGLSYAPSLFGTVAQRVLSTPELLDNIFSFLGEGDHVRNALVCKSWSEVAFDILWRDVDDLPRMLHLLAPTEIEPLLLGHKFTRSLEPDDWTRFTRYASRVRNLVVTDDAMAMHLAGPSVFDEIAQTRTTLHLFPKLSSLTWGSGRRLRLSLMFMHEKIKRFAVNLAFMDQYPLTVYFQEVSLRMPRITHLDLRFTFSVSKVEQSLCQLFDKLPNLQSVILPKFTITAKIMETLSRKEQLGVVQFQWTPTQGQGDATDVQDWAPTLQEGAFPALYDFGANVQLTHMLHLMSSPFFPTTIRLLYVHVTHPTTSQVVRDFLSSVAEQCPHLTSLTLDYAGEPFPYQILHESPDGQLLTLDTIRPILQCQKLTSFELHWETPLAISQQDIEELASSWTALESLTLACDPMPCPHYTPLTLEALIPFARHCPNLRELGLYVAATSEFHRDLHTLPPTTDVVRETKIHPRFQSLKQLFFGLSSIDNAEAVAMYLSQLCPASCKIVSGAGWSFIMQPGDVEAEHLRNDSQEWYKRWEEVDRLLPILVNVREEERATRSALEREVEDLRVLCRVLEERHNLGVGAMSDSGCILL